MPTDEIPDDIAALLRDRATGAPAAGAQARWSTKTTGRGDAPAHDAPTAVPATVAGTAALAGFAAGLLSGIVSAYLVVTLLAPPPPDVPLPAPVPVVQPQALAAVAPPAPAAPARVAVKPAPVVAPIPAAIPASSPHGSHAAEHAAERAWLDAARTALAQDDFDNAKNNLETAGARFPDGALREEREALAVHVLIARGDQKLAELAFNTFRTRHPGSLFTLAIEDAMREREATR